MSDELFGDPNGDTEPELCKRCWEPDCPGTCGYPVKPLDEEKEVRLRNFPYMQVYKVRNMFFAVDVPVFTAAEGQDVGTGFVRIKHIYCCN